MGRWRCICELQTVAGLEIKDGEGGTRDLGTEVPQRGPGAEPRWGSGREDPCRS